MTLIADGAPPTTSFRPMEAHGTGDRPVNDEIPFFDVVLLFSFFPFFWCLERTLAATVCEYPTLLSVEEGAGSVPRCEFYGVFFHCLRYVKLMSLLSDVGSGVQRLAESSGMRRRFTNVLPKRGRNDESKASMN